MAMVVALVGRLASWKPPPVRQEVAFVVAQVAGVVPLGEMPVVRSLETSPMA